MKREIVMILIATTLVIAVTQAAPARVPQKNVGTDYSVLYIISSITLNIGEEKTVDIVLSSVPATGLSFINITVEITSPIAEIVDIEYPPWAAPAESSSLPASTIWFRVGDLNDNVKAGDTNVTIATLKLKGISQGTAGVILYINSLQDDSYAEIKDQVDTSGGTITVTKVVVRDATQEALALLTDNSKSTLVQAEFKGVEEQINISAIPKQKFPTDGDNYVVISTGKVSDVFSGTAEKFISTNVGGVYIPKGHPRKENLDVYDVASLNITLKVPENAHTLTFKWQFGTEEIPSWLNSEFMDFFTAKLILPNGYVKEVTNMPNGEIPTVNTIKDFVNIPGGSSQAPLPPYPVPNDVALNALTTAGSKDEPFEPFKSVINVEPYQGQLIKLSFQIGDASDAIYDSAVFLDEIGFDVAETVELQLVEDSLSVQQIDDTAIVSVEVYNPSSTSQSTTTFDAYTGVKFTNGTVFYTIHESKAITLGPQASTQASFNVTLPDIVPNMVGYFVGVKRFDVPPQSAEGVTNQYEFFSVVILPNITVSPSPISVAVGSSEQFNIVMDKVPATGFSFANISVIVDPPIAEIVEIQFPSWALLKQKSSLSSATIWFKVGDLNDQVKTGDTNVALATLTIKGTNAGEANIELIINDLQDDYYNEAFASTVDGKIYVTSAAVNITINPVTVGVGQETTINIVTDKLPTGLSYANITVTIANSSVAQIEDIQLPSWAILADNSSLPSSTVWFKEGDLADQVKAGDTDVVLATLTIKGLTAGTSDITITVNSFQDDNYQNIKDQIATVSGTITVITGPPPIDDHQPMDLNGDGLFEDVNGDGYFNFGDIVFFFKNFDKDEIKGYPEFYDFNGDGQVNFGDVIELFYML